MSSVIGIIPARGGSKGVVRKNVELIAGKPMMGYIIEAALNSDMIDLVVVSTDDDEIAVVAEGYGVRVIRRPAEYATDSAPIDLALRHVIRILEDEGQAVDLVVWLQANVPTTQSEIIDQAVRMLVANEDATSVQTVLPYPIPPQWAWRLEGDRLVPLENCYQYTVRRQDTIATFHLDGAVNALRRDVIMNSEGQPGQAYFGETRLAIVQDPSNTIEIDGSIDLEFCRFLFEKKRGGEV